MAVRVRGRGGARRVGFQVLFLVTLVLLAGCRGGPTAEEIVSKMKEVEASISDAHALIEVSLDLDDIATDLVLEVWEMSPNRLRAEVIEDSSGELRGAASVTDGEQAWIYDPEEHEVLTGPVGAFGVDEPVNPQRVIEQMRHALDYVLDHSDVELVGQEDIDGASTYKLVLRPRQDDDAGLPPPLMGTTTLWVDQERWVVVRAEVSDSPVGAGSMHVQSYALNEGVSSERFRFDVPPGATVRRVEDLKPRRLTLEEALGEASFNLQVPSYLPEGVSLIEVFETNGRYVLRYDHGEAAFTVVQSLASDQRELPSGAVRQVTVRGQPATLLLGGGGHALLAWTENGMLIAIGGRISEDQVMRIAESLS